ncbi:MAG: DNA gyrase inhibitor YacG [Gammaproteobacteria bacterium]|nr:DNA gyrase inhibitor YacG [Gammaproteobacteria bacterium]
MMLEVTCPNCKKTVAWTAASRWKPFCSERCKLIDLGEWFEETNRISDNQESSQEFLSPEDSLN